MRIVFCRTLFLLLLIIVNGGSAFAEDLSDLQPGTRIRATYVEHYHGKTRTRKITGNITELTDCTLNLFGRRTDEVEFLPRENITLLERSIHPSRRNKAMKTGLLTGASLAAVVTIVTVLDKPQPGE